MNTKDLYQQLIRITGQHFQWYEILSPSLLSILSINWGILSSKSFELGLVQLELGCAEVLIL
jgi:hypothetical protein